MEAISFISGWVTWLLLIIPVGTGFMVTYFSLKKALSFDVEEKGHCDVRIKQTIKGAIVAISISSMVTIIKSFYN